MTRITLVLSIVLIQLLSLKGFPQQSTYCDSNLVVLSILEYDTLSNLASVELKFPKIEFGADSLHIAMTDKDNLNSENFSFTNAQLELDTSVELDLPYSKVLISNIVIPKNLEIQFKWWGANLLLCDIKKNYIEILPE